MNRINRSVVAVIGAAVIAFSGLALSASSADKAPAEWDGLQKTKIKNIDLGYVRPGVDLTAYKRIMIDPVEVRFSKDWNPNRTGSRLPVSQADRDEIAMKLGALAEKTWADVLSKDNGYPIAKEPAPDVMRLSTALIDVYINAPDVATAGRSRTYVMDAGHMTLVAEMRDGETGALFARVVDVAVGTDTGQLQWSNSVENSAEARDAVTRWAKMLRKRLDAVHEHPNIAVK
jgi:hypothetical protein